jgi:riboflavin synthase alpha subunit
VDDGGALSDGLQAEVAAAMPGAVEILNAGQPGYSTTQAAWLFDTVVGSAGDDAITFSGTLTGTVIDLSGNGALGDSIALSGCCLTVVEIDGSLCHFELGSETLSKTNFGRLAPGQEVNCERSLRVGDRLGGHFVTGHIDGLGLLRHIRNEGQWRFYEFTAPIPLLRQMAPKGSITIDGTNIQDFELSALRKHIGVVLQDVFLFSSSIYQNITLGNPNITKEQVLAAAELVGASKFIEKLPGGLDYNVMERGATLSVGQRQLISFVRAMVYNPEILILDEATSSVDSETEQLIQESIEKMMQGRTSIVIAHRLSTIQKADQILVLNKGEIVETGTHQSLLEKGGYYTQLHQMQLKMTAL